MKKFKLCKTLVTVFLVVVLSLVSMVCVMAADTEAPPYESLGAGSGTHTFKDPWEAYKGDDYGTYITYGFNTLFIDEDYCWAEQKQLFHFGTLRNDNGWHDGPIKAPDKVSKIEVTHSGSSIYYACYWG